MKPRTQAELDRFFCDVHTDRDGRVTVALPSIGVRRTMCDECSGQLADNIAALGPGEKPFWRDDPRMDEPFYTPTLHLFNKD